MTDHWKTGPAVKHPEVVEEIERIADLLEHGVETLDKIAGTLRDIEDRVDELALRDDPPKSSWPVAVFLIGLFGYLIVGLLADGGAFK